MDRYLIALSRDTPNSKEENGNIPICEFENQRSDPDLKNNSGDRGDDTFHKKKYKITYKYNLKWDDEFSEWLTNRDSKPYCKSCNLILEGRKSHIVRHSKTKKHIAKMSFLKRSQNIQVVMENLPSTKLATYVQESELKLCMFLSEHNLPHCSFERFYDCFLFIFVM